MIDPRQARKRRTEACVALAAAGWLLGGCIPIPLPPRHTAEYRYNLDERSPDKIVVGGSVDDVLLLLGEPDAHGEEQREISYHDKESLGTLLLVGQAGGVGFGTEKYRDLVVWFDLHGVVEGWHYMEHVCKWSAIALGNAGGTNELAPARPSGREGQGSTNRAEPVRGCTIHIDRASVTSSGAPSTPLAPLASTRH